MFWNTASGAMQATAMMAIGRSFDQSSPHNLDRSLKLAQADPVMFSEASLRRRKQGTEAKPPAWLEESIRDAHIPSTADFRRLRSHVKKHRRTYESNYRDWA